MFSVGRKLLLCALITILTVCVKVIALNGFRKVALGNGMIGGNPYSLKTDVHHKSRLHADNLANKKLCSSYTMLLARGTRSSPKTVRPFETMLTWIREYLPGGEVYHVHYPADDHQEWGRGSDDIVDFISKSTSPCFSMLGYSQGAAAVVDALPKLPPADYKRVKAVVLFGNPLKWPGKDCIIDEKGQTSTRNTFGQKAHGRKDKYQLIYDKWEEKILDICYFNDGVCGHTDGIHPNTHAQYEGDSKVQSMGSTFVIERLQGHKRQSDLSSHKGENVHSGEEEAQF